jgi:lipoprotein-releasing system permease protein
MRAAYAAYRRQQAPPPQPVAEPLAPLTNSSGDELSASQSHTGQQSSGPLPVLPAEPPQLPPMDAAASTAVANPTAGAVTPFDPYADLRPTLSPEEMFDPAREQHTGLVLGVSLASRRIVDADSKETTDLYLFKPGDDVHITLPTAGANLSPITEHCTVVDLYRSNMHEYDSMFAFMPLSRLQHLRGMIDPLTGLASASAIQIKLRPGADLNQARDKLAARFPPDQHPVVVQTWQDTQRPLLSAVELEVTILNILLFLIIAVAGFGILATFFMIVVEKTRDIGILKSLGAPSRGVGCIFLSYGLSLGAVGTGVGVLGGLLIVHYINGIAALVQRVTGREIFDPTIYYFSEIPTIVRAETILWIGVGAIAIAVLASVLPALRAARLHPVEALRYE